MDIYEKIGLAVFVLGVLIFGALFFASESEAASFSYNNSCYSDTPSALESFRAGFPVVSGGDVITQLTSSSINAAGVVTFTSASKHLKDASWADNGSTSVQLGECVSGMVASGRVEYVLVTLATVACFLFGFSTGKNQFSDRIGGAG